MLKKNTKIQNKTSPRLRLSMRMIWLIGSAFFVLITIVIALLINLSGTGSSYANGTTNFNVIAEPQQEFSNEFNIANAEIKQVRASQPNTIHIRKVLPVTVQ